MLWLMTRGLRIVIASYGSAQFRFLYETLTDLGHFPIAYLISRSMRPAAEAEPDILESVSTIIADLPVGMDLFLPGRTENIAGMLAGYRPDVVLVFGFNWRLPRDVLELPKLGVLNVHPSALPKYRGPSPVLWAIRNGDLSIGVTVHRMDQQIDAGPVLAQLEGIPLPDRVTGQDVWQLVRSVLPDLVNTALTRAAQGDSGIVQDEAKATYAGFPPADWYTVNWDDSRNSLHNQIRVLRFLNGGQGPMVEFQGRQVRIDQTSLQANGGIRVACIDGPLWLTCSEPSSG